jgi:hypothetical protein
MTVKLLSDYTSTKHLPWFLSQAGNISSALCSRILGIPVARECRIFHKLETIFITHDALWVANDLQESQ